MGQFTHFCSAGLFQFSNKTRFQWLLNTHQTKGSLLKAIANLQQGEGGNTFSGDVTTHRLIHTSSTLQGLIQTLITSKDIYSLYLICQQWKEKLLVITRYTKFKLKVCIV